MTIKREKILETITATTEAKAPALKGKAFIFWLLLLFFVGVSLLWPGDQYWGMGDNQAGYINMALAANDLGMLSPTGTSGSFDFKYHPLPIWIYQLFLSLTDSIVAICFLKNFITIFICVGGLYYLSDSLHYPRYPVLIYLFSIPLLGFSRELSEDSWLIPFSLLLFVSYAWFYKKKTVPPFICGLACLIILFFLHPRGVIIAIPVIVAFGGFHHHWIKKHWLATITLVSCGFLICLPYLINIFEQMSALPERSLANPTRPSFSLANMLIQLILGGSFFTADHYSGLLSTPFLDKFRIFSTGAQILLNLTMLGYLFIILGMVLCVIKIFKKLRKKEPLALADQIGAISLLTIAFHAAVVSFFGLLLVPEYTQGIWFCYFFFMWQFFNAVRNKAFLNLLPQTYGILMGLGFLGAIFLSHFNVVPSTFSLGNMTAVAKQISNYSPQSEIIFQVSLEDKLKQAGCIDKENAQKTLAAFYKKTCDFSRYHYVVQANNTNFVYRALVPLVKIQYKGKDIQSLPTRRLTLKYSDDKKNRLVLIESPL